MGGQGSGRKPNPETIARRMSGADTIEGRDQEGFVLPNLSGVQDPLRKTGNYLFPTDDGTNGQVMKTDGSGNVTWQDLGGGSGTMTTVKEGGTQLGGADIVTLDFDGDDFNLTETPDTEVNISVNVNGAVVGTTDTQTLTNKTIDGDDNTLQDIPMSATKLVAGTNITLSTDTLNVDDAFIINNGNDTTTGSIATSGDFDASGNDIFRNILIGTEASPGAASGWPQGTVYLQYTA